MAILETSFLIDLVRGKESVMMLMEKIDAQERNLLIGAPTVQELWLGACLAKDTQIEKEKIGELLQSFNVLPFDEKSARIAGEIESVLIRRGQPIEVEDVQIAGIAMSLGEKVVTRDEHFARIPGLQLWKY
ncbi:PIN domain-containing protein [Candidatus Woesearchaeota archaeon]|nr:PIN domain-containing protein [Candidatus Woesearchaeota archaeon]